MPCGLVTSNGGHIPCNSTLFEFSSLQSAFRRNTLWFKYKKHNVIQIQVFKPLCFHVKDILSRQEKIFELKDLWKLNWSSNPPSLWNFLGLWPLPLRNFQLIPSAWGDGYFLEPCIIHWKILLSNFPSTLLSTYYRLKEKAWTEELPPLPLNGILDPVLIDPLGRTRLKKLKTRPWTPGKPQV